MERNRPDAGDTSGFREQRIELDQEIVDDLDSIYADFEGGMDPKDEAMKAKLARKCLDLMDDNSISRGMIIHYSKILSKFSDFMFMDELDDYFKGSWEIIKSNDSAGDDIIGKWKGMHSMLKKYVADKGMI